MEVKFHYEDFCYVCGLLDHQESDCPTAMIMRKTRGFITRKYSPWLKAEWSGRIDEAEGTILSRPKFSKGDGFSRVSMVASGRSAAVGSRLFGFAKQMKQGNGAGSAAMVVAEADAMERIEISDGDSNHGNMPAIKKQAENRSRAIGVSNLELIEGTGESATFKEMTKPSQLATIMGKGEVQPAMIAMGSIGAANGGLAEEYIPLEQVIENLRQADPNFSFVFNSGTSTEQQKIRKLKNVARVSLNYTFDFLFMEGNVKVGSKRGNGQSILDTNEASAAKRSREHEGESGTTKDVDKAMVATSWEAAASLDVRGKIARCDEALSKWNNVIFGNVQKKEGF
ncbi:hypothetical protein COLO4_07059 [Corchorus olitorius]|uniref:Zinc knuckle CX2CX4HX4C n=1 Tax=Corchorus olitorius TaxID=93759 RepID=A0A1R3KL11_9ROSI|nr:hypothetical protein COLO4_07059 [Corchorus olitorius]